MCFSLQWLEQILIWLVVIVAVVAILKLFLPWVFAQLGVDGGIILRVVSIVVWAIVVIAVIIIVLLGGAPLMPRMR